MIRCTKKRFKIFDNMNFDNKIKTERLILRPWRNEDLETFAKLNADPRVMEYFPSTLNREESNLMAEKIQRIIKERGWGWWAVSVPGISDFIGFIGLNSLEKSRLPVHFSPAVEIGWRLAYEHWGKGYATEGARACLKYGFEKLGLNEIVSFTAVPNIPSQAVMKKIGMHHDPKDDFDHPKLQEGHNLRRHVLYRLTKDEWLKMGSEVSTQSHEQMIETIILLHFKQSPKFIRRMVIGICNEVYEVGLDDKEIIVRLSYFDKYLMGSRDHIPKLKTLGIKVPEILLEDYVRDLIPMSYQIQTKIEGKDLGQIIETLSTEQLKSIAKEVANIFSKVRTIPSSDKFGVIWGGGDNELSDTWTERMKIWIEESKQRGKSTGVMDSEMEDLANSLYESYRPYFSSIKPTTYYGDISSKNIMIHNGAFNGLVDLDGLTQGDPLEAVGRIKLAWYGADFGAFYTKTIMEELRLNMEQRKLVIVYALINKISWVCENGIQFNQNTNAVIDRKKERLDKKILKMLAAELGKY
jgi:RimJ/RimL family protein N-acetyltransferase/aminoglycoside phosphotransferase (APT) family kinase protein